VKGYVEAAREVFIVMRWDGFTSDTIAPGLMSYIVRVKAVHVDERSAQREVDRLNAIGRAHYFYQSAPFFADPVAINET